MSGFLKLWYAQVPVVVRGSLAGVTRMLFEKVFVIIFMCNKSVQSAAYFSACSNIVEVQHAYAVFLLVLVGGT